MHDARVLTVDPRARLQHVFTLMITMSGIVDPVAVAAGRTGAWIHGGNLPLQQHPARCLQLRYGKHVLYATQLHLVGRHIADTCA
jgi:hypothetical protein